MASVESGRRAAQPARAQQLAMLGAGDALAFLIFAAIGRSSHGEAAGFDALAQVAVTAAPFLIGWLVVSPVAGTFKPEVVGSPRRMLTRTGLAWLGAWPLGLALRALLLGRGIPLSFALVTLVTVLVILAIWRGLFALTVSRSADKG